MAKRMAATRRDARWTVMVFMGADTEAGNAPMIEPAAADLREMRAAAFDARDSDDPRRLSIFAQVHARGVATRHHVGVAGQGNLPVPVDEQDTRGGHALKSFISWSLERSRPRPGDHTMLVLWGHAYEFAIGHAKRQDGTIDALDFAELKLVLADLQREVSYAYGLAEGYTLDILGFDACDLATVEMAYQLRPFAKYLLGSQIGIPIPGWPYDRILRRLATPMDRVMGPAEFGSYIVRRFCESYTAASPVSLTLLDLQRAPELSAHVQALALALQMVIGRDASMRAVIAELFARSQTAEDKPYVDVADLCMNLVRHSGDAFVMEAARALGNFLLQPRPPLVKQSAEGAGRAFVVEHGRNAGLTARLNGISLYAPHVAPFIDFESVRHLYENFDFVQRTRWSGLVHNLARLSLVA